MHRSEIPIAHRCPVAEDWSKLPGDDRKRLCGQCSRHVHDLSAMDEDEARDLVSSEHVCVRYTVDARGQILHRLGRAALALGADPRGVGRRGRQRAEPEPNAEPGWLPWLAERAAAWWSPQPPITPVPPLVQRVRPPIRDVVPHEILGGVPLPPPDPRPPRPVRVEDRTTLPHELLESSCCGRAPFEDGRATISVRTEGYVEIVGAPSTRLWVYAGDDVLCEDVDGQPTCRLR